jgi:hypothetical protein
MKNSVSWDITPVVRWNWTKFRTYFLLSFSGLKNKPSKENSCLLTASCWFLASLTHESWRWRRHVPSKCWFTFNRLHGITSQKTELIIFKYLNISLSWITDALTHILLICCQQLRQCSIQWLTDSRWGIEKDVEESSRHYPGICLGWGEP